MDMGAAVGANAGASGMIALMAAAAIFNRSTEAVGYKRQIAFGFFDGESFGHMGSRRFVRDMATWNCNNSPMGPHGYKVCTDTFGDDFSTRVAPTWYWVPATFGKLNATEYVLAVDQVGRKEKGKSGMYIHGSAGGSLAPALASGDYGTKGMGLTVGTPPVGATSALPPSAADAFVSGTCY